LDVRVRNYNFYILIYVQNVVNAGQVKSSGSGNTSSKVLYDPHDLLFNASNLCR